MLNDLKIKSVYSSGLCEYGHNIYLAGIFAHLFLHSASSISYL